MHLFRRPDYRSEATQFLTELKAKHPELIAQQATGLSLLWDKIVDRAAGTGYHSARVAQKPYVYQTENK